MKQTEKYQLNLIETSDRFLPDPINENTQALEDALVAHAVDASVHSDIRGSIESHIANKSNPHGVTAAQAGAAAASHNHSAANITSGTLAVARGGTGNTSVDTTPTSGSTKMVTSGGIYTALAGQKSLIDSHTSSISSLSSTIAAKYGSDNPAWVVGTYAGTGTTGTALTVNVGFQPSAVFIAGTNGGWGVLVCSGGSYAGISSITVNTFAAGFLSATSTGFSALKSSTSQTNSINESGSTYFYIAFK